MEDKVIEYESVQKDFVLSNESQLEAATKDGLNWVVTYSPQLSMLTKLVDCVFLTWTFEWVKLKEEGIDGFIGKITATDILNDTKMPLNEFSVELVQSGQKITRRVGMTSDISRNGSYNKGYFNYELKLQPYRLSTRNLHIDQIFNSSADSDVVLLVENYKLHVNKAFLSIHSDFFRSLFSSNFKEGSMSEIPIEEVKYEDFSRLLAVVHPKPVLPTDESVESLLKLAEYFQMPFVISVVEHHLLGSSHFDFFQTLFIADKYKMEKVIEKCIGLITTLDHVKRIKGFREFENLDHVTKSKILSRLMQVV